MKPINTASASLKKPVSVGMDKTTRDDLLYLAKTWGVSQSAVVTLLIRRAASEARKGA